MSFRIVEPLCFSLGLLLGSTAWAGNPEVVYSCTNADGAVELSNTPSGDNCEQLIVATPPAAPAAPAAASAPATPAATAMSGAAAAMPDQQASANQQASSDQSGDTPLDTRLAQYRETMVQGATNAASNSVPPAATNPAINRRYLMMNRAAYMSTLGTNP